MTSLAFPLPRVLIRTESNFSWPHLNALAVHRLDEPASRERYDPLRLRILVPIANPPDRKHRHHCCRFAFRAMSLPLRFGRGTDRAELKLPHDAPLLAAYTFLIGPEIPICELRFFRFRHAYR